MTVRDSGGGTARPAEEALDGKIQVRGDTASSGSGRGIWSVTVGSFSFHLGVGNPASGELTGSPHENMPPYLITTYVIRVL
jgi:hypothetical protein